eukprot:PhF_6_TR44256/c0_g1_i1/m.68115
MNRSARRSVYGSVSLPSNSNLLNPTEKHHRYVSFISDIALLSLEYDIMRPTVPVPKRRSCVATVMFVDVSGYSKAAAILQPLGPHALADAVNGYYSRMLSVIHRFHGDVVKFAGDAIIVVWSESNDRSVLCGLAALCAAELQSSCGEHNDPRSGVTFNIHIGLTCGHILSEVFLSEHRAYHFLSGSALSQIEVVVDSAPKKCVGCSPVFAVWCPTTTFLTCEDIPKVPEALLIKSVNVENDARDALIEKYRKEREVERSNDEDSEQLKQFASYFVPDVLRAKLIAGVAMEDIAELRYLYVFFIGKVHSNETVCDWFDDVHSVLLRNKVTVIQILDDDKGVHIVAALNLFLSEGTAAAEHVLHVSHELVEERIDHVMGVAGGMCFTGLVGSDISRRYDITGWACVRACRLMQYAVKVGIPAALDQSVVESLRDRMSVRVYSSEVYLKGTQEPVTVFIKQENRSKDDMSLLWTVGEYCEMLFVEERDRIRDVIMDPRRGPCAILVSGHMGSGKKTFIASALRDTGYACFRHVMEVGHVALDVYQSIAIWFSYHENEAVRREAQRLRIASKNTSL